MSRKYIKQILDQSFVYPNNEVPEYDIELVHDINDNCVEGNVSGFTVTSFTSTGLTATFNWTWDLNGAERVLSNANQTVMWGLYAMAPGQVYYKPFRLVQDYANPSTSITALSSGSTVTITPTIMGLTGFTSGTWYFEMRMIGKRCVLPICITASTLLPTPTPTPTSTPTPTPTPTSTPTPTPTISPEGEKSLQIYGKDISGERNSLTLFYSINGGGNINVPGYTGGLLPSTCSLLYTITGLTTGDNVTFGTDISCVMNGNGSSSTCPFSSGSAVDYTYVIDVPTTQQAAITIDSSTIP
jgi:hypothetical protein